MKKKSFPDNPFMMTFARITMIDAAIIVLSIALAVWKQAWMWYAIGGGVFLSIVVFIVLNKRCLQQLSCPKCKKHIVFEAENGFVCKKCNIGWEM